jgi:predicted nucleic acid-binding protein
VSVGLDTSVVVRLLVGEPAAQAERARRLLDDNANGGASTAVVSDLVVGESYFALRHHYGVPHTEAVAALRELLSDPRVHPSGAAADVLAAAAARETAPGFMDRLIHANYRRMDAVVLVTFDRAAAKLPKVRLLT